MSAGMLWEARPTKISFSRHGSEHLAVELTLVSDPTIKLTIYEVGDGMHIWQRSRDKSTVIPTGQSATDRNFAFVEALVNPQMQQVCKNVGWDKAKVKAAALARKGQLSPETREIFDHHLGSHVGLMAQSKRHDRVQAMKSIVKQLGDLTEEEMLDIWREARAEEVMDS